MTWLLNREPFEVQSRALQMSDGRQGFCYYMQMGLGKSATLLADYLREKARGTCDMLVVVAPYSLVGNWKKEATLFPKEELVVKTWPLAKGDNGHCDVLVINYEAFAVGGAKGVDFVRQLCESFKVMLALDESAQIKNNKSVRTKALLSLARSAAFTRLLSGAPMVQGPQDLWSQLKFVGGLQGVNFYQFRNRYCLMGGYQGKKIMGPNPNHAVELSNLVGELAFRAKKEDWLDLPPKTFYSRPVTLSPQYQRVYKEMAADLYMQIEGREVSADMAITLMLKLQQISSGFIIDDEGIANPIAGPNAKLNEMMNIIDTEVDTKVVIPVYFRQSQALVAAALDEAGIKYARILGQMTPDEIEHEKGKFNNEDDVRVALAQTSSQKYGHTLLGTENAPCHTTIFYENTFSLDDRLQMEDRNHRIGQRFGVNVIDLTCSPIEQKVVDALQSKDEVAKVIVDAIKTNRI